MQSEKIRGNGSSCRALWFPLWPQMQRVALKILTANARSSCSTKYHFHSFFCSGWKHCWICARQYTWLNCSPNPYQSRRFQYSREHTIEWTKEPYFCCMHKLAIGSFVRSSFCHPCSAPGWLWYLVTWVNDENICHTQSVTKPCRCWCYKWRCYVFVFVCLTFIHFQNYGKDKLVVICMGGERWECMWGIIVSPRTPTHPPVKTKNFPSFCYKSEQEKMRCYCATWLWVFYIILLW